MNVKLSVRRPLVRILVPLALSVAVGACSGDAGPVEAPGGVGEQSEPARDRAMPAIYVDQRIEILANHENRIRDAYLQHIERCRREAPAEGIPIRELSSEDVEKLGEGRLQRWFKPDSVAIRWEEWRFGNAGHTRGGGCTFLLSVRGHHTHYTPERTVSLDLDSDADGAVSTSGPPEPEFFARAAIDDNDGIPPVQAEGLRQSRRPGRDRTVAGQPCWHRSFMNFEACAWAGGRDWGFRALSADLLPDHVGDLNSQITLEYEPAVGTGLRLTTTTFDIGTGIDESEMIPGGAQ
ncbi:MAG: hypothetical protein ACTHXB_03720 [Luteimonas sp.]